MSLTSGTRLGPYEIAGALGAGGMGEVYRATDTKLKRQVAIKILPPSVAADHDRLARFQREAEVLASLNHPNIAGIYGLDESPSTGLGPAGMTALVMELVEGEDLSAIIARGPIPIADALPLAKQIADALEAAHEQGIIHRDLKPANIKVRADGTVKVLDFGLAKAMDPAGASSAHAVNSPTLTAAAFATGYGGPGTEMGMILGTAAYMAPEQAKGKAVDKRADIWAFGVVLHEMLTGQHLFLADTIPETLAHVMTRQIDLATMPVSTPRRIRDLVARCLEKDPKKRLRDIGEARLTLEEVVSGAAEARTSPAGVIPAAPAPRSRTRERLAWGVVVTLLVLVAAAAIAWALGPVPVPAETRLEITTPATDDPVSFAISPDGRQLVFVASATSGQSRLWLRPLDQTTPQALAGTEGALSPFWSPDSRSVAFFAGSALKRLDIGGGLPQTLVTSANASRGGSWSAAGVILVGQTGGPLLRVAATGGPPADVTKLAPEENSHRWPHFLPGGRQFLFYALGASSGLYLGSLDSPESKRIATTGTGAQFVAPDWLLFVRQSVLVAQHVDLARGELTGEPVPIADPVAVDAVRAAGAFSVSPAGLITYRTGRGLMSQFTWFDRSGTVAGTIGSPDGNGLLQPTLSPDGRRVAAYRAIEGNMDVWLFEAGRETRLTSDPGRDLYPVWSPDGSRIAFSKDFKGQLSLFQKSSMGGGAEELLVAPSGNPMAAFASSPDGRFLMYSDRNPANGGDLWVLPLDGTRKPSVFVNTKFDERHPQFSPDGRWVAYASDETGRQEIYLRPFPASSGQFQVSTSGGVSPRWRHDGKELYYIAPDSKLMAVSFSLATSGSSAAAARAEAGRPEMGAPVALFQPHILYGGTPPVGITWQYDVARDGRFLINVIAGDTVTAPITVIQNWGLRN